MRRSIAATALMLASATAPSRGEHAKITLDVKAGDSSRTAFVDQTPPPSGKSPRPVITARAGAPIKVEWMFQNVYPHKTLENVVIHFFIAPEEKAGQKDLPPIDAEVVLETAFDMDFKPGARAGARTTVRIETPGAYLVRVESIQTGSDHEHFAAIDLVVEPAP